MKTIQLWAQIFRLLATLQEIDTPRNLGRHVPNQNKPPTVLSKSYYLGTLSRRHIKCLPFNCECQDNKLFSKKASGAGSENKHGN